MLLGFVSRNRQKIIVCEGNKRRKYLSAIEEFARSVCVLHKIFQFSTEPHFPSNLIQRRQHSVVKEKLNIQF